MSWSWQPLLPAAPLLTGGAPTGIIASPAGGNWSDTAAWVGGVVPTASDNAILNATSGNITIDGTSGAENVCLSLDCTGYTNTLDWDVGYIIVYGSITLSASMTLIAYSSSFLYMASTTTGNTITCAGQKLPSIYLSGAGGEWICQDPFLSFDFVHNEGTFDTNDEDAGLDSYTAGYGGAKVLNAGASTIAIETFFDVQDSGNFTVNSGTSTVEMRSAGSNNFFKGGGLTYNDIDFVSEDTNLQYIGDGNVFNNVTKTVTSDNGYTGLALAADQTINGTLTINGYSATRRALISSTDREFPRTVTANAIIFTNTDVADITGAGAADWNISGITGNSGDCGGNSGITFTTPVTSYWVHGGGTDENYSAALWASSSGGTPGTSRVPLVQDAAKFDSNSFSATGKTVTMDMARFGDLDFTGTTNSPTLDFNGSTSLPHSYYGNVLLAPGMTCTDQAITILAGDGNFTFDRNGVTWGLVQFVTNCIGEYTVPENHPVSTLNILNGTLHTVGTLTSSAFVLIGGPGYTQLDCDQGFSSATFYCIFGPGSTVNSGGNITINGALSVYGILDMYNSSSLSGATTLDAISATINVGRLETSGHVYIYDTDFETMDTGSGLTIPSILVGGTSMIHMGSGTWELTGTGNIFDFSDSGSITLSTSSANVLEFSDTSGSDKYFNSGGLSYNIVYVPGGSGSGVVSINQSPTIFDLLFDPLANIEFASGSTTTVTTPPAWTGTSGNPITIASSTPGVAWSISVAAGPVVCDYIDLTDSTALGDTPFYAGSHSVNGGGNTDWLFLSPPQVFNENIDLSVETEMTTSNVISYISSLNLDIVSGIETIAQTSMGASITLDIDQDISTISVMIIQGSITISVDQDISSSASAALGGAVLIGVLGGISAAGTMTFGANLSLPAILSIDHTGNLATASEADFGLEADIQTVGGAAYDTGIGLGLAAGMEILSGRVMTESIVLGMAASISLTGSMSFGESVGFGFSGSIFTSFEAFTPDTVLLLTGWASNSPMSTGYGSNQPIATGYSNVVSE